MAEKRETIYRDKKSLIKLLLLYAIFLSFVLIYKYIEHLEEIKINPTPITNFAENLLSTTSVYYMWSILYIFVYGCYTKLEYRKDAYHFARTSRVLMYKYDKKVIYALSLIISFINILEYSISLIVSGEVPNFIFIARVFIFTAISILLYLHVFRLGEINFKNRLIPYVVVILVGAFMDILPNILFRYFGWRGDLPMYILIIMSIIILGWIDEKKSLRIEYI